MNGSSKIFHQLTKNGDLAALKKMIEDGFEDINGLDDNGEAPILIAIIHKYFEISSFLKIRSSIMSKYKGLSKTLDK